MKCKLKPMLGKISLPGSLEMREENNVYYKCEDNLWVRLATKFIPINFFLILILQGRWDDSSV